jgi:hypothetical protein
MLYTTRRLLAFFNTYPELIPIALGNNPNSRVMWDGIYRFFYRHFPMRTDEYVERGKTMQRRWWYNEETFDPKWDKLMREYKVGFVFNSIIQPYLAHQKGET